MRLLARGRIIEFPRPLVMGIVNLSVDSFSGDGLDDVDAALNKARGLVANGADIIDLGAESARTNRLAISEEEETERLCAFISRWNAEAPAALLSINTWRPGVAKSALKAGGDILNDISALPTDENARICAGNGAALLIMHSLGEPKVAHTHIGYDNIMARLETFFTEKIAMAEAAGVPRESLIIDPGIDFAKQRDDNLRIYRELGRLRMFERPILLPVSRKTVIGEVLNIPNPAERDAGTVACIVQGMLQGASIFRVHNVRAAVQTLRIITAVEQPRML
ncbi:MAG: Dihydropteroate synthase [Chthoniobacteraceae bacterium]|nr:Dihydropteroate synthase [Chthoniobacteraceae bacterium]